MTARFWAVLVRRVCLLVAGEIEREFGLTAGRDKMAS